MPRYPSGDDFRDNRDQALSQYNKVTCRLVNETKYTWRWEDFRLQEYSNFWGNGPWMDNWPREIGPGGAGELNMTAQKGDRGVEVWVTFNTDVGPLEFHFNNPYVGSNSYHTYKLPDQFISVHNSGEELSGVWKESEVGKWGRNIDGKWPRFQWTIKQRN